MSDECEDKFLSNEEWQEMLTVVEGEMGCMSDGGAGARMREEEGELQPLSCDSDWYDKRWTVWNRIYSFLKQFASPVEERRSGHSRWVYDKITRTIKSVDPNPQEVLSKNDQESVPIFTGTVGAVGTAGAVGTKFPKPPVRLCLNCDCHGPRCMIWMEYVFDNIDLPFLAISIQYCHPRFIDRLKMVWKLLRTGSETRDAVVVLNGKENIRKLKNFAEECLIEKR